MTNVEINPVLEHFLERLEKSDRVGWLNILHNRETRNCLYFGNDDKVRVATTHLNDHIGDDVDALEKNRIRFDIVAKECEKFSQEFRPLRMIATTEHDVAGCEIDVWVELTDWSNKQETKNEF